MATAIAFGLSGCDAQEERAAASTTTTASPSTSPLPVTGSSDPPPSCTEDAIRQTVTDFLQAYSTGAPDTVERFIAPPETFQWFADPERPYPKHPDSDRRETLSTYLAQRRALGEVLTLDRLDLSGGYRASDSTGNFGYALTRSGSVPEPRRALGKGAVDCRSGKLMVWLIGQW